jgi:hypothetical protein
MIKQDKNIIDTDDFNCYASDMFDDYLSRFSVENGLKRYVNTGDVVDENWEFIYTNKGVRLAEKYIRLLNIVFDNHFPEAEWFEFEIYSHLYQEE